MSSEQSVFAALQLTNAVEDATLYEQQIQLSILETAPSFEEAQRRLHSSSLANTDWKVEQWEPHMLCWRSPPLAGSLTYISDGVTN